MKNKVVFTMICLLCVGFIIFNSSQTYTVSNLRSYKVTQEVVNFFSNTYIGDVFLNQLTQSQLNTFVRKLAHAFEFFILALAVSSALLCFKFRWRDILIYTLFIVLFIAVMDEFFQIFVEERTSKVADVVIDFCGGICAEVLFFLACFCKAQYKRVCHGYNSGKHARKA